MMAMKNEHLYTKGTRVWVPDPEIVWIGAVILEDLKDDQLELELEDGREVVLDLKATNFQLPPLRNPEILVGSNDLTTLSYLHEPAVLHNLQERFINSQCIYTYCGIVLVALNPYQNVPLYSSEIISAYSGKQSHEIDPHIYAVAENAYRSMVNLGHNQSIIVSGESGAGKTVSAKYTMRYFANVGGSSTESTVEQKVLASNPIMEAIGNAKTIRNDNSSRFGKFIEINFDSANSIIGANMKTYLLEKSRVVFQAPNERNYHIFHQLCACSHLPELQELKLGDAMEFYYTQQGENPTIQGVDDTKDFQETCEALSLLGIYSEQQRMIWRILAAILHLGNVSIDAVSKNKDGCYIRPEDVHSMMVATLLGIDKSQLQKWLCARKIVATGDVYVKPLTLAEASNGRDALAKHIYSMLFNWIVEHINSSLAITTQRKSFIGVLDIYGFETFEVNSFEQFCINYANEKLQQQFNQHVFKLEQEEYIKEKITWSFIDFYDNQSCIDLIETKLGILDLLDEECRMPKGSDEAWALKLYKQHLQKSDHFVKPRMSEKAFIIRHYADDVIYDCNGFVEKNRDLINDEHINLLCASEYELVGELFRSDNQATTHAPRKRTTSRVGKSAPRGKKTVGSEFRDSLKMLMETLNSTAPHYVRCIKSNDAKEAFQLDLHRCVQQLRACGVLETIRISAAGYPSRWTYNEFFDRYRMLVHWKKINWDSLNDTCNIILSAHITDEDKFQLGKTKIFFRAGAVAYLERLRSDMLRRSCVMIQKHVRCWLVYRKYQRMKMSAIRIQCWTRGYQAQRFVQNLRETRASIRIQKIWRGYSVRKWYLKTIQQLITFQAQIRGLLARRRLRAVIEKMKSIVIQKYWRMYVTRKEYLKTRKGIILIQCCVRRMAAKKELKQLKIEARSVEHFKTLNKGMENKVISLQQKLSSEKQAKKALQGKVEHLMNLEEELNKMQNIKPQMEQLVKTQEKLNTEKEELAREKITYEEKWKTVEKELATVEKTKDEEIASLKAALADLQKSFDEQIEKSKQSEKDRDGLIEAKLQKQREELTAEFTSERSSHQKMIGEYSRLEQRYDNLQQELQIEKTSPDKRRHRSNYSDSFEVLSTKDANKSTEENNFEMSRELSRELSRERDMLLEQVELLQEEHDISLHVHENDQVNRHLVNEKDELKLHNESLTRELEILRQAVDEKPSSDGSNKHENAITKLLAEIKELRDENKLLRKKSAQELVKKNPSVSSEGLENNNLSDAAQKEVSRLTMENINLREEINDLKVQLKDQTARTTSPSSRNQSSSSSTGKPVFDESIGLGSRTRSNVTELSRKRSQTIETRINEGNLSEAGKLLMTYAGLSRKKQPETKLAGVTEKRVEKKLGLVKFNASNQDFIVGKLVTEMRSEYVEKAIPGLPAHIMFMSIRYIDYVNQERLMQSYLTAIISSIKRRATENSGDIDNQAFWLANTFRLYCDMKQFSGDQQFQTMNTREQNEHCLLNFDLSEYRQVLSDTCIKIYQDMVHNVQTRINNLIVPGMLEYESIPGVVSTLRRFKSEQKKSEDIITVKDITNKLSAILAVLNAHCVEPSLIKQIFRQIYYFINSTMINNILLRKDMCHWSRGLQIKFNLTQLEEWCRTNQLHDKNGVVDQLEAITEVVQLLQVNKKTLEDVDGIIAIVKNLNALQVQKILSMYTPPNEYEPRIPGNLIRAVVSKLPKLPDMFLMFDLKYITPMVVGFVPSNVNLDKVVIPSQVGIEDVTEVI